MKHPPFECFVLIALLLMLSEFFKFGQCQELGVTVPDGQFKWGACLLKSNGGVYQG